MRVRIKFAKKFEMKYTSHLDLHRTWERTIRRTGLPLVYSQGFNPRPKINLAAALPLGVTSDCEFAEFWLREDEPIKEIRKKLKKAIPPGIEILGVENVELNIPKIPNLIMSAVYEVALVKAIQDLSQKINTLLSSATLKRNRRGKDYDLRPLVFSIEEISPMVNGEQRIILELSARPGATGRPDEVLSALGIPLYMANIKRINLIISE